MNDLISRAAAIDALTNTNLKRNVDSVYDGDMNRTRRAAQRVIAQLPAVDAVPVIMCRDCKYWKDQSGTPKWLPCCEIQTSGMWYCADGERRDEDVAG